MSKGSDSQRRRFYCTEEARSWAKGLSFGNAEAKSVLVALTAYVNDDAVCFPSISQLARDTDLSHDTVRRRLAWLEALGAISRSPRYIDATGRRSAKSGKRTTDEIQLRVHLAADDVARSVSSPTFTVGSVEATTASDKAGPGHREPTRQTVVSPAPAIDQPSQYRQGLISEPEPEDSPYTPKSEQGTEVRWNSFAIAWECSMNRSLKVQQLFASLPADEQADAILAARGYFVWRSRRQAAGRVKNPLRFLKNQKAWPRWIAQLSPESRQPLRRFVAFGSTEWQAQCVIARIADRAVPTPITCSEGSGGYFAALPTDLLELAAYAKKPLEEWCFVARGSLWCDVWCRRLNIAPRPICVSTKEKYEVAGRIYTNWSIKKPGLLVPILRPPGDDEPQYAGEENDDAWHNLADVDQAGGDGEQHG